MQELLDECKKSFDERDYSRLEWLCNKILEQDKHNEIALTYKAYCNWRHRHIVFRITDEIHKFYPDNYHAYNAESLAHMNKGEFEEALKCCERGLQIKDHHWLRRNKIESMISLNRIDEAYEFYSSSQIPDYNFTKALVNCGKYSEISRYGQDVSDGELVDYFLKRCRKFDNRWGSSEVLKICEEIFKIDKDNEIALEYKIHSLAFLEKDEEVLECSDYAIELYPDNYRFYFQKAETLLWSFEDVEGAIELYEKGLSMVDDFENQWPSVDNMVHALYKKADQVIESGDYNKAIGIYDKILFYRPREFKALENIESIAGEHDINYENTKHYNESLKLRERSRQRVKKIDGCLNAIEIGEYDDDYIRGCGEFKDYDSFDEYLRDLIIYLMESYPGHSEEHARFLVKCNMDYIRSSYEYKEPVAYCSIEVGYCCG